MAFSSKQSRALKAKLAHRHVKSRINNGATIAYVEGWHVVAEANRIFGFDSWDRTTVSPVCVWSELQRGQTVCFYSTRVRIRVRAGGTVIIRDGIGTGVGRATSPDQAHEIALKAAETDATKRALSTFGNPFGLALYDKDRAGVSKPEAPTEILNPPASSTTSSSMPLESDPIKPKPKYALAIPGGQHSVHDEPQAFIAGALEQVPQLATLEAVYAFWEANAPTFGALRRTAPRNAGDPLGDVIAAMKERARLLGHKGNEEAKQGRLETGEPATGRIAFAKEKRVRDKAHLAFVASLPCTICGRQPSHAHHLRFAQPRAMAMKVSDEFTVPLCAVHHDEVHRTGDERAWWARRGKIEPLKIAAKLWEASRRGEMDAVNLIDAPASGANPEGADPGIEAPRSNGSNGQGNSKGLMPRCTPAE